MLLYNIKQTRCAVVMTEIDSDIFLLQRDMCVQAVHSNVAMVNVSQKDGVVTLTMIVMTTVTKKAVNARHAARDSLHVTMDDVSTKISNAMLKTTVEISRTRSDVHL